MPKGEASFRSHIFNSRNTGIPLSWGNNRRLAQENGHGCLERGSPLASSHYRFILALRESKDGSSLKPKHQTSEIDSKALMRRQREWRFQTLMLSDLQDRSSIYRERPAGIGGKSRMKWSKSFKKRSRSFSQFPTGPIPGASVSELFKKRPGSLSKSSFSATDDTSKSGCGKVLAIVAPSLRSFAMLYPLSGVLFGHMRQQKRSKFCRYWHACVRQQVPD